MQQGRGQGAAGETAAATKDAVVRTQHKGSRHGRGTASSGAGIRKMARAGWVKRVLPPPGLYSRISMVESRTEAFRVVTSAEDVTKLRTCEGHTGSSRGCRARSCPHQWQWRAKQWQW